MGLSGSKKSAKILGLRGLGFRVNVGNWLIVIALTEGGEGKVLGLGIGVSNFKMSYSLNSLNGVIQGAVTGLIKGDTRSLRRL